MQGQLSTSGRVYTLITFFSNLFHLIKGDVEKVIIDDDNQCCVEDIGCWFTVICNENGCTRYAGYWSNDGTKQDRTYRCEDHQ